MCGRYVLKSPPASVRMTFGYVEQPNFPPRYNIAPTQPVPVVTYENETRHFRLMRWGLIPAWVKDPKKFSLVINARSEGVTEKPAFKNAMKRRRCLLPADGYYEWQQLDGWKQPLFVHRADGTAFGFAGVWETWTGPNGEEMDTVAIVTTAAASELAGLHPRVPVTIEPQDYMRWLDCSDEDAAAAVDMLRPPDAGSFVWHPVSNAVNRFANDEPQLVLPITENQIEAERAAARPPPKKAKLATKNADEQGNLF